MISKLSSFGVSGSMRPDVLNRGDFYTGVGKLHAVCAVPPCGTVLSTWSIISEIAAPSPGSESLMSNAAFPVQLNGWWGIAFCKENS
jgi:hypothetical protein